MPKNDGIIRVEHDGQVYDLDINDVNGLEGREFRQKVGRSLKGAFYDATQGELDDLEPIAGLLWLVKRREDPSLDYDKVLETLTYGSIKDDDYKPEVSPDPPG